MATRTTVTVQVKALSARNAVLLGPTLEGFIAQFMVVCRKVRTDAPESFVLMSREAVERAHRGGRPDKIAYAYWLETKAYEGDEFRERWDKIGSGLS